MSNPSNDNEVKTTLHGKPLQTQTEAISRSMEGGLGPGPNTHHPGFTDKSLIRIPIKVSDYLDFSSLRDTASDSSIQKPTPGPKKGFSSVFRITSPAATKKAEGFKAILMTRGDYLKYWNVDEKGEWAEGVTEPEEGRAEWLRKQIVWQEEHAKSAPGTMKKETDFKSSAATALAMTGVAVIGGGT